MLGDVYTPIRSWLPTVARLPSALPSCRVARRHAHQHAFLQNALHIAAGAAVKRHRPLLKHGQILAQRPWWKHQPEAAPPLRHFVRASVRLVLLQHIRHAHRSSAGRAVAPVMLCVQVHGVQLQRSQELAAPPLVLALPACRRCPSASTPRPCPSSRPAARIPVSALAFLVRAPRTHRECACGARSRLRGQRRACLAARAPTACGGKA